MQHIHILGICGTFMGGLAAIAKSLGYTVTGSDTNVYPPMSTQLERLGIELTVGYDVAQFSPQPDVVIIGNALSRGNPAVEYVLDRNIPYISGPQWLLENYLQHKWVLAVAGTHGKTTTASMLAWILEHNGYNPGFLIGGVPQNFGISARSTEGNFFVIEADEYDSAFFDKRSKFVHYRPRTLVLNNLEFDHADIFDSLEDIKKQFHHCIRTVPASGRVICNADDPHLYQVIQKGCWSEVEYSGKSSESSWRAEPDCGDCSKFKVFHKNQSIATVQWELIGEHNMQNGLTAIAAAHHVGVKVVDATTALNEFSNVKRRMEIRGVCNGVTVYDDFAHHPTAIRTTVEGLRKKVGDARIFAVLEPRSNTMRMGIHRAQLAQSWELADHVHILQPPGLSWSLHDSLAGSKTDVVIHATTQSIVSQLRKQAKSGDHILIMSNGGFDGIHDKILAALAT